MLLVFGTRAGPDIEEGYLRAERGEIIDGARARHEIQIPSDLQGLKLVEVKDYAYTGKPYREVYDALNGLAKGERKTN